MSNLAALIQGKAEYDLSEKTGIPLRKIKDRDLTEEEVDQLHKAGKELYPLAFKK